MSRQRGKQIITSHFMTQKLLLVILINPFSGSICEFNDGCETDFLILRNKENDEVQFPPLSLCRRPLVVHDDHINPDCACGILQSPRDRGCYPQC